MADDPLYAPLGLEPEVPRRRRRSRLPLLAGTVLVLAGGGIAGAYLAGRNLPGVDPVVVSTIQPAASPRPEPASPAPSASASASPEPSLLAPTLLTAPPAGSTVEYQNGVKVVRLNPATSATPVRVAVEPGPAAPLARAPDPRVSETTPDGVLPRIGKGGIRPSAVYARPALPGDAPRVVLVALGAGRDQLGTAEAGRRLPGAIDFALPPDVPDVATQVGEARRAGREVVLDLGGGVGDERALRRSLGAWAGYVGVRLPAGAGDAARQAEERGLVVTGAAGDATVVDAADAAGLEAALTRLAGIARAKGIAVGLVENAIPGRDALAQAADRLVAAQGVVLAPLSTLASPAAATAAR